MRGSFTKLILEAEERQSSGNYGRSYEEETGGKASSAAPTRGNGREPLLWRNRRNGRWLVKAIIRRE